MAGEVHSGPNLNQKSRLFDNPKAKATTPPTKVAAKSSPTSVASPKADVKPVLSTPSGPNLNQKSRLFSPPPVKTAAATTPSPKPASPKSPSTGAAKSASKVVAKASPEDSSQKPPKKATTFSRIVICYCCGQGFSIHSVVKHYDKCRERRPANYKSMPKEATCPPMPAPNKLPVPSETSTAADFQAFNDEAFQIYKAHLVQCPWGCGRTTEPDRTAVHMRGCALRPKPPPTPEGEEANGENKEEGDTTDAPTNEAESDQTRISDHESGDPAVTDGIEIDEKEHQEEPETPAGEVDEPPADVSEAEVKELQEESNDPKSDDEERAELSVTSDPSEPISANSLETNEEGTSENS